MTAVEAVGDACSLLWQRQSVWSQAAGQLKKQVSRARTIVLSLNIAAAVLGTAAAQVTGVSLTAGKVLAFVAAFLVALGPLIRSRAGRDAIQDWTRLRSVSETMKADLYTFLAGVAPFRGVDADRVLLDRMERLLVDAAGMAKYVAGIDPVQRPLPAVHDVGSYITVRLAEQIAGYYRPKARQMRQRASVIRRLELGIGVVGAALAVLTAVFQIREASAWVGVATTITAALTAHAAAARYEYQQLEYTRTADELDRLRLLRADNALDDKFVAACEHVISIQNEGWMAKLTMDDEAQ